MVKWVSAFGLSSKCLHPHKHSTVTLNLGWPWTWVTLNFDLLSTKSVAFIWIISVPKCIWVVSLVRENLCNTFQCITLTMIVMHGQRDSQTDVKLNALNHEGTNASDTVVSGRWCVLLVMYGILIVLCYYVTASSSTCLYSTAAGLNDLNKWRGLNDTGELWLTYMV